MRTPKLAHLWERHPQDWYVEPEWCSRRLFQHVPFIGDILDPACGFGRIVIEAGRAGHEAYGMDIVRRTTHINVEVCDWLEPDGRCWDNIVSNPPFSLCSGDRPLFIERCLQRARDRVAMLLPVKWLSAEKRSRWLQGTPVEIILMITPRPSMPPGPVIEAGEKPGNGLADFCWIVWRHGADGSQFGWLRRDL